MFSRDQSVFAKVVFLVGRNRVVSKVRVERHCVAKALLVIFRDSIAGWFAVPVAGTSVLIRAISTVDLNLRCRKSVFRPCRFDVCSDPVEGHFWVQWRFGIAESTSCCPSLRSIYSVDAEGEIYKFRILPFSDR